MPAAGRCVGGHWINMPVIEIQNVDVLFGAKKCQADALVLLDQGLSRDDIQQQTGVVLGVAGASLSVDVGNISVLMGLSGSGKSSLLRCVNGLNRVTRGSILLQDANATLDVATLTGKKLRDVRRHRLAMVFQQFALLPWATVRENIAFGLSVRGEKQSLINETVDRQLELVHLQAWADKAIHTLSGGMQQRVGLARAFATDAEILLMDEPFSALDPLIREHLQDELLTLQQTLKKTILFVSHDLDEALKIGNQISIMEGGRIVQTGTSSDIVFKPATDYVRRFVANINPLSVLTAESVMQTIDGRGDRLLLPELHCEIWLKGGRLGSIEIARQARTVSRFIGTPVASPELAIVPLTTPMKILLSQFSVSDEPVIVVDDNRPVGFITPRDVMIALNRDTAVVQSG
ncbi:MAG: ATP-binding cassette domain-containing protein [Granulosicoccus sp.]